MVGDMRSGPAPLPPAAMSELDDDHDRFEAAADDPAADRLGEELASHVQRAFALDDPPRTYRDLWQSMMTTYATELDRDLGLQDLCTTEESPHWAAVGDARQHYQCVTDAYILGTVLEDRVTARTTCAVTGEEILVEFDDDDGVTAPEGAVLAYGVRRDVEPPEGQITPGKMYSRFCPYNRAFASRAAFEEWADSSGTLVAEGQDLERALSQLNSVVGSVTGIDEDDEDGLDLSEDADCSC